MKRTDSTMTVEKLYTWCANQVGKHASLPIWVGGGEFDGQDFRFELVTDEKTGRPSYFAAKAVKPVNVQPLEQPEEPLDPKEVRRRNEERAEDEAAQAVESDDVSYAAKESETDHPFAKSTDKNVAQTSAL